MIYLLFIVGFVLLIQGAKWLVKGATSMATRFGISELVIGLTIVSLGTSMPELLVSVIASTKGNPGLATGNILGSNIANILLIMGATAVVCDLPVRRRTVLSEVPFSLTAALLVGFLANSSLWYEQSDELNISRGDGVLLLFFFLLFVAYVISVAHRDRRKGRVSKLQLTVEPTHQSVLHVVLGVVGLYLGGKWVVDGAVHLAGLFNMSDTFIGLTVVALGTSLPELVTSLTAARRKKKDIAVGNAIGSNIFNLLWILGISAVIRPLPFDVASNVDILVVIAASSMVLLALIIGRRLVIKRVEGIVFLAVYAAYLAYLIIRG